MINQTEAAEEFLSRFNIAHIKCNNDQNLEKLHIRIVKFIDKYLLESNNYLLHYTCNSKPNKINLYGKFTCNYYQMQIDYAWIKDLNETELKYFLYNPRNILIFLQKLESLLNVYGNLEIYNCLEHNHLKGRKVFPFLIEPVKKQIEHLFQISNINIQPLFDTYVDNDQNQQFEYYKVKFYPKGDQVLDSVLVNQNICIIKDNSKKLYLAALDDYLQGKYHEAGDKLRKSLEAWFKGILAIEKSNLDGIAKGALSKELKKIIGKTTHQEPFIEAFIDLVRKYMPIHDTILKHPQSEETKFTEPELEFILYQTGAIIRFIDKMLRNKV